MPEWELQVILKSVKGYMAREINRLNRTSGRVWQRSSYDHIVRDAESLAFYRAYIRENPLKAKLSAGKFTLYEVAWVTQ